MNTGVKYFCVSDIHSYYQPLLSALSEKGFDIDNPNHKLIICGDAFDRGDDTVKVFQLMKRLQEQNRLIYILGNHEELLFDCVKELLEGKTPSTHHFHNKTVKTVCMLCGENEWLAYIPTVEARGLIKERLDPVLTFIKNVAVDYFELGNKIFVHSWIPCVSDDTVPHHINKNYKSIDPIWNMNRSELSEQECTMFNNAWSQARWGNPFLMWKDKLYPQDKCIVFGHWHCSYGHSHIDMKYKEWPHANQGEKFEKAFRPWIKENAIGIDACCAYSGFINCVVFDEKGELIS